MDRESLKRELARIEDSYTYGITHEKQKRAQAILAQLRECKTCHGEALPESKYCTACWSLASQNGETDKLIAEDRKIK